MGLLDIKKIRLSYGPVTALKNISLTINEGEIVSLLGANGAGKTSILRAISALETIEDGEIFFDGEKINGKSPHAIVKKRIAHAPEGRRIFSDMTVAENLEIGAFLLNDEKRKKENREKVFTYFPILKSRLQQAGGTLSGGEQQMLAVGRALMSSPRLLMLDEPSLGLAPQYIDHIFEIIRRINSEEGMTIFLIEQNANEALQYSHRAYVLENGNITLEGTAEELQGNERVQTAYLGL